jgi:hypothetical protein
MSDYWKSASRSVIFLLLTAPRQIECVALLRTITSICSHIQSRVSLVGRSVLLRDFSSRSLSQILDRIDQHEAFDPTKHYQLTIDSNEMTAVERESQAQSVDDIELEP